MREAVLTIFLVTASVGCGHGGSSTDSIRPIIAAEVARKPAMQIQDLYKLLHQAALGSEHAVESAEMAKAWMEREIATLRETSGEALMDTLSPDGRLVRVNLRPYLAAGGDPSRLVDAFVRTANKLHGSHETFDGYLAEARAMSEAGLIPFDSGELKSFFEARKADGYPAMHHSAEYEKAYSPAYRVVDLQFLQSDPIAGAGGPAP